MKNVDSELVLQIKRLEKTSQILKTLLEGTLTEEGALTYHGLQMQHMLQQAGYTEQQAVAIFKEHSTHQPSRKS